MFVFRISRSGFSESHLSEYLQAEQTGLNKNCVKYHKKCEHSLFHEE